MAGVPKAQEAPTAGRRARERAFRTTLILEAAEEVFASRGFDGASVEEIAGRAEVAIGTLYKHFGSKESIFAALVEHRQDEFLREVETFLASGAAPRARLDRLVESVFRYFDTHAQTFQIYLGATHGFPWHIRSSLGERAFGKYQQFLGVIRDLLQTGMDAAEWPSADAQRLAVAVMGSINGVLTHRHTADPRPALADDIAFTCELTHRMLGRPTPPAGRRR